MGFDILYFYLQVKNLTDNVQVILSSLRASIIVEVQVDFLHIWFYILEEPALHCLKMGVL